MEHLNKRLKGMLHGLGSNISPESVQHASKVLGLVETVCTNFENISNITSTKDYHSMPSFDKDLQNLDEQLVAEKMFQITNGWSDKGFHKHKQLMALID